MKKNSADVQGATLIFSLRTIFTNFWSILPIAECESNTASPGGLRLKHVWLGFSYMLMFKFVEVPISMP